MNYTDEAEWDVEAFNALKESELQKIREEGADYDRKTWFRQEPYFRYFRKFKKTFPVMMQVESFLLKGKPFPEGNYVNGKAELHKHCRGCVYGLIPLVSSDSRGLPSQPTHAL